MFAHSNREYITPRCINTKLFKALATNNIALLGSAMWNSWLRSLCHSHTHFVAVATVSCQSSDCRACYVDQAKVKQTLYIHKNTGFFKFFFPQRTIFQTETRPHARTKPHADLNVALSFLARGQLLCTDRKVIIQMTIQQRKKLFILEKTGLFLCNTSHSNPNV